MQLMEAVCALALKLANVVPANVGERPALSALPVNSGRG
jgi:hypothetical protein